jgi:hypothetical protein
LEPGGDLSGLVVQVSEGEVAIFPLSVGEKSIDPLLWVFSAVPLKPID